MSVYRFVIPETIPFEDAEDTFQLARFAIDSGFGESRAELEIRSEIDRSKRSVDIDINSYLGTLLARMYLGYLMREFPDDAPLVLSLTDVDLRHHRSPQSSSVTATSNTARKAAEPQAA